MKKRYISDGFIVIVEDYITSINFIKHDHEKLTSKVRVYRNISENIITVSYSTGAKLSDLPKNIMFKITNDNTDKELTVLGKVIPEPTVIINGLEYIFSDTFYKTINIYRLHYCPELGITQNKLGIYRNNLYIALVDDLIKDWTLTEYRSFINHVIYIDIIDRSKFNISNAYGIEFNNKQYEYKDFGIMGLNREFYLNDTNVIADFIRQMRNRHPEIQFYTREEDKNSTEYNEWINYTIQPSPIKTSNYGYTSHVRKSEGYGRVWKNSIDNIEFEYQSKDVPTLLTRRDQFRVGKFLNEDRVFNYIINDTQGDDFDIRYTVFWERDSIEQEYGKQTSKDDSGYSLYTFNYKPHIQYMNLEDGFDNYTANVVDSVIYTILYIPPKEDANTWDEGYTLDYKDLDFKSFMLKYIELASDFQAKYGIDIFVEQPHTLGIEEYGDMKTDEINEKLIDMILNIKSIKQSAIKESNYVMVASLKQVQSLLQDYRIRILESFNTADFDIEDSEPEDHVTLTIEESSPTSIDRIPIPSEDEEEPEPVEPPTPSEEEDPSEEDEDEGYIENYIMTDGTYKSPKHPLDYKHKHYQNCKAWEDDTTEDELVYEHVNAEDTIVQQETGNSATLTVNDDDVVGDDNMTLEIELENRKKNKSVGVIL